MGGMQSCGSAPGQKRFGSALAVGLLGLIAGLGTAEAIPAHSRTLDVSCSHCHAPFPRLNETGLAFLNKAFGGEEDRARSAPATGSGADTVIAALGTLPLALRADLGIEFRPGDDKGEGFSDFKTPMGLRLISEGRMIDGVGYAVVLRMTDESDVSVIEDASLRFDDLFGSGLDLTFGQFPVNEWVFSSHRRLTFQKYLPHAGQIGLSRAALGHDRGLRLDRDFDFGLSASALIVNGSGADRADALHDFDPDQYKNYALRLAQDIGPVRLGLLAYWGKERARRTLAADGQISETNDARFNETFMWGPDLTLEMGPAQIRGQYIQRRDLNPYFKQHNEIQQIVTHSYVVEATARLLEDSDDLFLVALFNLIDSGALDEAGRDIREESYTLNLTWCLAPNLKLLGEYTFAFFHQGQEKSESRITLGFIGAL